MTIDTENTPLEQCDDCGRIAVSLVNHTCSVLTGILADTPNRDVRRVLAAHDTEPADDEVVHTPTRWSVAYHIPAEENGETTAACHNGRKNQSLDWVRVTRGEAKDGARRHPCTRCHDIDFDAVEADLRERGILDE